MEKPQLTEPKKNSKLVYKNRLGKKTEQTNEFEIEKKRN